MAREARDRMTQAVLPLTSSIIRAEGATLDEVLDDQDFKHLVACLGVGICLPGGIDWSETFKLEFLRYGKVILALDRSNRGTYIREQFLALARQYMHLLFTQGHIYSVQIDSTEGMTEEDFRRQVMCPETRALDRVES